MISKSKIHYPFTKKYVNDYVKRLFGAIKRGECVTSIWVASAGRRVLNRFIVDNANLFKKELPNYKDYLLIYIEPLDLTEESQTGYLRLVGRSFIEACQKRKDLKLEFKKEEIEIFEDEKATYSKLLGALRTLISRAVDQEVEVVLFLGEIDELKFINTVFCNNLRSLWNSFNGQLHFISLIKNVRLVFTKDYFGEELGYLFFQNLVYVPVAKENEDYLTSYFEKRTGYKLTPQKKKIVSQMCDGHPYFLKLAIESLAKNDLPDSPLSEEKIKELLRANYEVRAVSERMIEILTDKAQRMLLEIATKKVYKLEGEELETLVSLGLVRKTKEGYYQPFCQLFQDAILKKVMPSVSSGDSQEKLVFDPKLNSIIFQGESIEEKFTRQEHELLTYFLKKSNIVHSRDEIAETIWGKESYEKYSDWAIDQLISKIRKKLKKLGANGNALITIRGRGYKFAN